MSTDDVAIAIQSSFGLLKEIQRRVDSSPSSTIDAELKQNLKLARIALLKATKKEVVLGSGSELTVSGSSSFTQAARSDGKRGAGSPSHSQPTALSASFDPTSTNAQRCDVFKSGPLWSVILCGFHWNKRKLSEQALTTMQHMLRCKAVNLELYTTLFLSPYSAAGSGGGGHSGGGFSVASPATAAGSLVVDSGNNHNSTATNGASVLGSNGGGAAVRHTKALCRVGEGIFVALNEYLNTTSEPAAQTRILNTLQALVEGKGQAFFVSKNVTRTIHAAFTVALQTPQEAVRTKSQHFLQLCVMRVTKGFVLESMANSNGPSGFATNTPLEDYTMDVEFDAPFTRIEMREPTGQGILGGERPGTSPSLAEVVGELSDDGIDSYSCGKTRSLDPASFFNSSLDESLVREAVGVLGPETQLPQLLKDLILLIKNTCRLATRALVGSPTEGNVEVRARQLALRMLERLFHELPVANCEMEHRCATWLSLALAACKYDIIRTLVRNFGVVVPFTFFESAIHILSLLLRKCHYHMASELHSLLAVYLLPLASSAYCDFRQKHAVLALVHELFGIPDLLISFFINYDCSPTFDAGGQYGGFLELLVDFVVDLTFADIVAPDGDEEEYWLNSDQQQLLRGECVITLHTLVKSMYRWIAEDPQSSALGLFGARKSKEHGHAGVAADMEEERAELYVDSNWAPHDEDEGKDGNKNDEDSNNLNAGATQRLDSETASSTDGFGMTNYVRSVSFAMDQTTGTLTPCWGRNQEIFYHWKHIHYLMHNKRIALDAVELINTGKWKDAKEFLESRRYIPARKPSAEETEAMATKDVSTVPAGASSYAGLARFVSQYPGISRDAISGIFERINKDPASKLLLRDYLHLFHYQGVPIDIAMRDTTCKFMSWDRPMFEAQVWEGIQDCFGEEYARQNPAVITAKDADTMAGVLLFLHSNLHNEIAKSSRFTVDQFVVDANACLDIPMEPQELKAMFERVKRRKWELDAYGRTPTEAERASTVPSLSFKVMTEKLIAEQARRTNDLAHRQQQQQQQPQKEQETASEKGKCMSKDSTTDLADNAISSKSPLSSMPTTKSSPTSAQPPLSPSPQTSSSRQQQQAPGNGRRTLNMRNFNSLNKSEVVLLDCGLPAYCDVKDNIKLREDHHIAFTRATGLFAEKLEALHRCRAGDRDSYHPQPYAVPHYAEHVRPMLLFYYPSVMACVYMGFRVLETASLSRQLFDITQILYDIAAAFVVNLGDMHDAVSATIQRCLANEHAYRLTPPTRATFVPFLLNTI